MHIEFFKKIIDHFLNNIIVKICGITGTIGYLLYNAIFEFFEKNMPMFIFLFVLGWVLCFFTGFKLYKMSRKKNINRIKVDREGECFCPVCEQQLLIQEDQKYVAQNIFYCEKCKTTHRAWLPNGKFINATDFYSYQQQLVLKGEKPQIYKSQSQLVIFS